MASDPELQAADAAVRSLYSKYLVNPRCVASRLSELKSRVFYTTLPEKNDHLTGPKFERAVEAVLDTQHNVPELLTFTFRSLDGAFCKVPRLHVLWLRQYFRFSNCVIAEHLGCSQRQVASMNRALKSAGFRFTKPRRATNRPCSVLPLPHKPKFNRLLSEEECAWISDVRTGKATVRIDGQLMTGPEAAQRLKRTLHRDHYKEQYDDWVYEQRHVGWSWGQDE